MTRILGISAYYHDAAAALVEDGRIVAAAQEERFTRVRHDPAFPAQAAAWCLRQAGTGLDGLAAVVFYDKPFLKFERLLETYLACAPAGLDSFVAAMPVWLKEKLFLKSRLRRELAALPGGGRLPPLWFSEHHRSHAASAFYPSPFDSAAVLCLDGVGEWAASSAWLGDGRSLEALWEQHFPHSLGLLYSAFTAYCGFRVNSGEYKLMGLAPYGEPRYLDRILGTLLDLKPDGTFRLDMRHFNYATGLSMTSPRFHELFGGPPRVPDQPPDRRTLDVAASIQRATEEIVLRLARALRAETGARRLCLAGGVALNCVANARLLREAGYDDVWVQPAAGDAGGALGAALLAWHRRCDGARPPPAGDAMQGALLGPGWSDAEIGAFLAEQQLPHERLPAGAIAPRVAALLAGGAVVGWFQGRMEFGPRALGARSILADPRRSDMQRRLNLKIKFRESFRPFAPAVVAERAGEYFEVDRPAPYMLFNAGVRGFAPPAPAQATLAGPERLAAVNSPLPAVTHLDGSARLQTVERQWQPRFHALLEAFAAESGYPVLVNTSFNVRGEPIVCTPADAWRCLVGTEMDYLVLGDCLLERRAQPGGHRLAAAARQFAAD